MDFAPYQSSPPEHNRPFSPSPVASPRVSYETRRPTNIASLPPLQHPQPQRQWQQSSVGRSGGFGNDAIGSAEERGYAGTGAGGGYGVSEFDTSLGVRLDYEAAAAYIALPPLGAIILLILEKSSDYVRFHAWQSSLLFTVIFILHLIFSWSSFLSWVIFIGDVVLIAYLAMKAYRDADALDRYEVPVFGQLASRIVDDE